MLLLLPFLWLYATASPPDTQQCCRHRGVSDFCVRTLCDTAAPPNDFQVFEAAEKCPEFMPQISRCLADGRDHMPCCKSTASDADQQACFDMCNATAKPLNNSHWELYKPYMTCLSFNIHSIYNCYRQGYTDSPDPPRDPRVQVTSPTSARIEWSAPAKFPELADQYTIYYRIDEPHLESADSIELSAKTKQMYLDVDDLRPDTKYFVYIVASTEDERRLSLRSEVVEFVSKGVGPELVPYKSVVHGPLDTDQTLACRVKVAGFEHRHLQIVWQKQTQSGLFEVLHYRPNGPRKYRLTAYVASYRHQPRTYVSALQILKLSDADYTKYRCVARNAFGVGSADVQLTRLANIAVPNSPANITACCERVGVHRDCLDGCQQGTAAVAQVSNVASRLCALDIPKVLGCSTQGMDQGACCLRRKVPSHCLPFCDGTAEEAKPFALFSCLLHSTDIFSCHLEAKLVLPESPSAVRQAPSERGIKIVWSASSRADVYYVFYREQYTHSWQRVTVTQNEGYLTELKSHTVYQVTVVAANGSGNSEPSRDIRVATDDAQVGRAPKPELGGMADALLAEDIVL